MDMKLPLGEKATDTVSGFTGTITAFAKYIDGQSQFCIQPPCEGSEYREPQWFAAGRVAIAGRVYAPA